MPEAEGAACQNNGRNSNTELAAESYMLAQRAGRPRSLIVASVDFFRADWNASGLEPGAFRLRVSLLRLRD